MSPKNFDAPVFGYYEGDRLIYVARTETALRPRHANSWSVNYYTSDYSVPLREPGMRYAPADMVKGSGLQDGGLLKSNARLCRKNCCERCLSVQVTLFGIFRLTKQQTKSSDVLCSRTVCPREEGCLRDRRDHTLQLTTCISAGSDHTQHDRESTIEKALHCPQTGATILRRGDQDGPC